MLLGLWITVGLTLGVLVDYLLLRHGLKPALSLITIVVALAYTGFLTGKVEPNVIGFTVVAFSSTRFVARPLLRRLGVRREEASASTQAHP